MEEQKPNEEVVEPPQIEDVAVAPAPTNEEVAPETADSQSSIVPEVAAAGDETTNETPSDSSTPDQPASDVPTADEVKQDPAPMKPVVHHSGAPVMAIVAAVLVAIGLAAVTVYGYMKTQNDTKPTTTQSADSQTDTTAETAKEIDTTSSDVDDAVKATEEADFPATELTDQNLNL